MSETIQAEITHGFGEVKTKLSAMSLVAQIPNLPSTIFQPTLRGPMMGWLGIKLPKPVIVDDGIKLNLNAIERDQFYEVEYEGKKYVIRLTKDGMLENYEVE